MNIDSFNQVFKAAGEKVLGFKKRKKGEWIQGKTREKIETRRRVKQKISSTQSERLRDQLRRKYSELDREVKKMTKLDKRKFVERLTEEAEEAAGRQDLKTLYRINKMLNNSFKKQRCPCKRHRWQCSFKRSRKTCPSEGTFQRQARPLLRFEALGDPRTSARRQRSDSSKAMF